MYDLNQEYSNSFYFYSLLPWHSAYSLLIYKSFSTYYKHLLKLNPMSLLIKLNKFSSKIPEEKGIKIHIKG